MTDKITVLGVGNILLKDEGVGVRVVEEMTRRYTFPENVEVLDGGTLGMELMRFLLGTDRVIIIDAIDGSLPPGSIYQFEKEAVKTYFREKISVHDLGIQDVLAALDVLEKPLQELVVMGVQPAVIDVGLDLTPVVAQSVEPVITKVLALLADWKVEVIDRE
ncbi:MAG: hydrogenase expression/formation protein [Firmicutes bacterium]|nr:hydrogenase expression/formation protein [Bacillota bacterium]